MIPMIVRRFTANSLPLTYCLYFSTELTLKQSGLPSYGGAPLGAQSRFDPAVGSFTVSGEHTTNGE